MRRGTPSAILFGTLVCTIRTSQKKSMRQLGSVIGCPAATISQTEKGQRALKEPKIAHWALALEVSEGDFRELWYSSQGFLLKKGKRVFYTEVGDLFIRITNLMDRLAPSSTYDIDLSDIKPEGPIVRTKSVKTNDLHEIISELTAQERNRVQGYVDAIIENRSL